MTALSTYRKTMRPGAVVEVTNHYATTKDHPSFGTTTRRVAKTTTTRVGLVHADAPADAEPMWHALPKASQITQEGTEDAPVWQTYGGGAAQGPGDLFLTVRLVKPAPTS